LKHFPTLLTILFLAIAANIFGLLWLTVAVLVTGLLLLAGSINKRVAKRMPIKRLRRLMWLPASAIVPAVLLRLFVFEVFSIPSASMENTLVPGVQKSKEANMKSCYTKLRRESLSYTEKNIEHLVNLCFSANLCVTNGFCREAS